MRLPTPDSPVLRRALLAPQPTRTVKTLTPLFTTSHPFSPPLHHNPTPSPSALIVENISAGTTLPTDSDAILTTSTVITQISSEDANSTSPVPHGEPKVPCVEITQKTVMEMQVGLVEDGSQEGGANISFPGWGPASC